MPILLVVASQNDSAAKLARFRSMVPAAEVQTIDSRHDLLADAPDETIKLVGAWRAWVTKYKWVRFGHQTAGHRRVRPV